MENKPITCPNCKSENIILTVTYQKAPVIRVLKFICFAIFLITVIYNIYDFIALSSPNITSAIAKATGAATPSNRVESYSVPTSAIGAAISIIFTIFFEIAQQYYENKTCIIYACKNCDHTWKQRNE